MARRQRQMCIRDRIEKDTERDNFMNGEEAKEYGLIDKVISEREQAK